MVSQRRQAPPRADHDPWGALGTLVSRLSLESRYWILPIGLWSLIVAASLGWNWRTSATHTLDLAANQARDLIRIMESVQSWNADHGGVYVVVTDRTPPDSFLKDPDRDVTTAAGVRLTKLNPAYMTRQLSDILRDDGATIFRISSLAPLNPANSADPWESRALAAFSQGETERSELLSGAAPQFRYMAPLPTTQACLSCHEQQGHRVGGVNGGMSVTFSPDALLTVQRAEERMALSAHLAVWALVSASTVAVLSRLRQQILSLQQVKAEQDGLVRWRTAELDAEVRDRRQAEGRLRLLIDSSGQGIIAVDRNGDVTLSNPAALRLLGYPDATALVGQPMRELIYHSRADGSPRPVRGCPLAACYRGGEPAHESDSVFWRADGRPLAVDYQAHPLLDEVGVVGAVVTFTDISERKCHERRLRILSAALEHGAMAIAIVDRGGVVEYVNRAFADMTGYAAGDIVGQNIALLRSGLTPTAVYDELWDSIGAGKTWQGELSSRRADGSLFWESISVAPILDDSGQPTHFVALIEDATERKRSHDEVWRQANFDALTGLPNRKLFEDRLGQAIAQARRQGQGVALLYIDLDGFKAVNDSLGHEAGDHLLCEAGRRIAAFLRSSDTVARIGGDEFAIVLPNTPTRQEIEFVADRILAALAEPFPMSAPSGATPGVAHVAASIGAALFPSDASDAAALVRAADAAMYGAKRDGGHRLRFHAAAQITALPA